MIWYTNNQNSGFYNCLCIGYDLLWGIICMKILSQVKLFKHKVWNISRFSVCALFSIKDVSFPCYYVCSFQLCFHNYEQDIVGKTNELRDYTVYFGHFTLTITLETDWWFKIIFCLYVWCKLWITMLKLELDRRFLLKFTLYRWINNL